MPALNGSEKCDPDYKLIEAIGTGDSLAFETLINKYQNPVLNFIFKYLGDRFGAEDLAQEVFLRIYRSAPDFEPRGKVSTWIFKIAYNLSVNEIVRRSRTCLLVDSMDAEGMEPGAPNPMPASELLEERELQEALISSIRRLPEKQRAALLLRVNDELSYSEISDVLSTSVSSVESLIFRARENLRKMLGKKKEGKSGAR
jgi:RNA polymerase sigma-70 factor (ECF subfamily)